MPEGRATGVYSSTPCCPPRCPSHTLAAFHYHSCPLPNLLLLRSLPSLLYLCLPSSSQLRIKAVQLHFVHKLSPPTPDSHPLPDAFRTTYPTSPPQLELPSLPTVVTRNTANTHHSSLLCHDKQLYKTSASPLRIKAVQLRFLQKLSPSYLRLSLSPRRLPNSSCLVCLLLTRGIQPILSIPLSLGSRQTALQDIGITT